MSDAAATSSHFLILLGAALGHTLWQGAILWAIAAYGIHRAYRRTANDSVGRTLASRTVYRTALLAIACIAVLPAINMVAVARAQGVVPAFSPPPPTLCPIHGPGNPACNAHLGPSHGGTYLIDGLPDEALGKSTVEVTPSVSGYWFGVWDYFHQAYLLHPITVAVSASWLLCALCLLAYHLFLWAVLHLRARTRLESVPQSWQVTFDDVAGRLRLRRKVALGRADWIDTPVAFGWRRPRVLMPAHPIDPLDEAGLAAAFAHELVHIRRNDYVLNLFQIALESLLFYHPAVWWLSARARTAREECCDDGAAAATRDVEIYARALAALESGRLRSDNRFSLAAARGSLSARIRRVLGLPVPYSPRELWGPIGVSAILVGPFAVIGLLSTIVLAADTLPARTIMFPENGVGSVLIRPAGSPPSTTYSGWEPLGTAQGRVEIPEGMEARVNVSSNVTDFSFLTRIDPDAVQAFGFSGTAVRDADLASIAHMTGVLELHMSGTDIGDEGLSQIQNFSTIEYLDINETNVTAAGTQYIAGNTNMEVLRILRVPLDDNSMQNFADMPNMRLFDSWVTEITDSGMAVMEGWNHIELLGLEESQVGSDGMRYLQGKNALHRINLENTHVGDKGLEYLCENEQLGSLSLRGTEVTEEGLRYIARMQTLRSLSLPIEIGPDGLPYLEGHPLYGTFARLANAEEFSIQVKAGGRNVPHAAINLNVEGQRSSQRLMTGENGVCAFYLMDAGSIPSLRVRAVAEGYAPSEKTFKTPLAVTLTVDLSPAVPIGGIVVDPNGAPLAGASVILPVLTAENFHAAGGNATLKTDENGVWYCANAPEDLGDFWIIAEHGEFPPSRYEMADLSLADLHALRAELVVGGGLALAATVTESTTDTPVVGAKVIAQAIGDAGPLSRIEGVSDNAGQVTLSGLPAAAVELNVLTEGYLPTSQRLTINEWREPVTVTLKKAGAIHGNVTDSGNKAIEGVVIESQANAPAPEDPRYIVGRRMPSSKVQTDASGAFHLGPVPLAKQTITLQHPDYYPLNAEAMAGDDPQTYTLLRKLAISGSVTDEDTGATVSAYDAYIFACKVGPGGDARVVRIAGMFEPSEGGQYTAELPTAPIDADEVFRVAIVAPDFKTALSPTFAADAGVQTWNATVRKEPGRTMVVRTPDGYVATGAQVAAYYAVAPTPEVNTSRDYDAPRERPRAPRYAVTDGAIESSGPVFEIPSAGAVQWPDAFPAPRLLMAHPDGYALISEADWQEEITLSPWARASLAGIAAPKSIGASSNVESEIPVRSRVAAEENGTWYLDHLIGDETLLSWNAGDAQTELYGWSLGVPLASGITTHVDYKNAGVSVRILPAGEPGTWDGGKIQLTAVRIDSGATLPPGYSSMSPEERAAYIVDASAQLPLGPGPRQFTASGVIGAPLTIHGLVPGEYEVSGNSSSKLRVSGYSFRRLTIPEGMTSGTIDFGRLQIYVFN